MFVTQKLFESANKPNRFLTCLAKNAPAKSFISVIQDESREANRQQTINASFKKFCTNWYQSEIGLERPKTGHFINNLTIPQISEDQKKRP